METVTFLTPTANTDDYNNPTADWSDPDELDVHGCLFAPTGTKEDPVSQQTIQTGILYTPAGIEVPSVARVRVRGDEWEVIGQPQTWTNHTGLGGCEVFLERTPTGGDAPEVS